MKRFISIAVASLFLLSIIGNSNCSQKDADVRKTNNLEKQTPVKKPLTRVDDPNSLTHSEIILFSPESQKLLFRKMNINIKANIWLDRVSYAASLFRTTIKKEKLLELKTFITPELYNSKSPSKNLEDKIFNWINENQQLFGLNNLRLILTSLNELKLINSEVEDLGETIAMSNPCPPCDPDPNWCTCSTRSDWCSGSNICGTGYNCTQVSGCGTLWAYTCDGRCGMW